MVWILNHTGKPRLKPKKQGSICGLWEIDMFLRGIGGK
jgi:hypothetical protein